MLQIMIHVYAYIYTYITKYDANKTKQKTMYNASKRYLWLLSRGDHKCRVQMTSLVSVNIKLKIQTCF